MRLLLTNDDGIFSAGLKALHDGLQRFGKIYVFAPDRERSAVSHALTLDHPLRAEEIQARWWAVSGTPTDCVNIGVLHFMKDHPPDAVISGINFGLNVGDDVTYSGTVSAAFEAHILGLPGVAFSQEPGPGASLDVTARFAGDLLKFLISRGLLTSAAMFNVNFPSLPFHGARFTRLGKRHYQEGIVEKTDPRGRKYYWIGGEPSPGDPSSGTDFEALRDGAVSVTPLHLDLTDYAVLTTCADARADLAALAP